MNITIINVTTPLSPVRVSKLPPMRFNDPAWVARNMPWRRRLNPGQERRQPWANIPRAPHVGERILTRH